MAASQDRPAGVGTPSGNGGADFEAWLRGTLPAEWIAAVDGEDTDAVERLSRGEAADELVRRAAAEGWLTPDWPAQYGGRGATTSEASEVKALLRRWHVADVRYAVGTGWIGPTILEWGTDEQRATLLPPIADASELWCQLFSEPDAGSDLASLRCAARRLPDGRWQVDGVKLWTSRADISRRGLLITRSDDSVPKHRGMTAFCLDLERPGVTIRPIRQMTGDAEFFEVVLDGVLLDDTDRLGPTGDGWQVCRTALSFERVAGSGVGAAPPGSVVGRSIEELIAAHRDGGRGVSLSSAARDRVVREWAVATIVHLLNGRSAARRAAGLPPGPEGSVTKVLQAEHTKRLQELFIDLAGPAGVAWEPGDRWAEPNTWAFLRVRAKTIAGGTSEVLRNQLAERILGLPRDEDPSRGVAWAEALRSARQSGPADR